MDLCIAYGAVIAVVVSLCKRVAFIRNHPKIVAAILAAASAAYTQAHPSTPPIDLSALLACFATQFAASVATYETVIQPVRKRAETAL